MTGQEILVVEDEHNIAQLLKDYLENDGFHVTVFQDGAGVVERVQSDPPSFLILDLMIPEKDGLTICRELRRFSDLPIMILTAKIEEIDRIVGLEVGADDYVCKPFSPREVVKRVHTILRRIQRPAKNISENILSYRDVDLDTDRFSCIAKGETLDLTRVEFNILHAMMSQCGVVFSRDKLINHAYSDERVVSNRTIDTHVKNLRKKLSHSFTDTDLIHSIYGIGYKIE